MSETQYFIWIDRDGAPRGAFGILYDLDNTDFEEDE